MRFAGTAALTAAMVFGAIGCANVGGYKQVQLHDVRTVTTETGQQMTVILDEPFLAFQEVIERSPNVKSVTRMTDLKGKRQPNYFALAPDGQSLVYQAMEKQNNVRMINLWKISTGGGTASTQVTAGRYMDIEPCFSPDGKSVYFASNRSSQMHKIWKVRSDGAGGITRVTQADSVDRWPDLSPDGKLVFYTSRPFNAIDWQIWHIGTNGSLPTQLKEGRWPKISPDGQKILYCAQDSKTGKWKIWVMNLDGTAQTQLTSDIESNDWHPSWSADGSKILFASNAGKDSNGKKNFDIWMMNADGSNLTQLTTNGSTDFMPQFSPDGQHIYFLSNRGFYWDIWRMEIIE